jgi:hypothetical protein
MKLGMNKDLFLKIKYYVYLCLISQFIRYQDYFDIIDTPMDFGTVCSNLEKNDKYMNSEDVYKDVQYIWENCYKYNNKGDYIVDLMRRVKKNFMKYWTAAGLYTDQSKGTKGETSSPCSLSVS